MIFDKSDSIFLFPGNCEDVYEHKNIFTQKCEAFVWFSDLSWFTETYTRGFSISNSHDCCIHWGISQKQKRLCERDLLLVIMLNLNNVYHRRVQTKHVTIVKLKLSLSYLFETFLRSACMNISYIWNIKM